MLNNTEFKVVIFADSYVGKKTLDFLFEKYLSHLYLIVVKDENSSILELLEKNKFPSSKIYYESEIYTKSFLRELTEIQPDIIILAWWPTIIKEPILSIPKLGCINLHPSLLPYNRGKHYNFWTIVEETPFGVTIHIADNSIDGGDILFQKVIEKTWEDTGQTLYYKARDEIISLFKDSYPKIVANNFVRKKQKTNKNDIHYAKELEKASEIILNKKYTAKELLNLLRARTFEPHPGCFFWDSNDNKYEIRIQIKKVL